MLPDLTPDPLAVRIAEGDPEALAALYARDAGWVYALAGRFVAGAAAGEVTEEVFDTIWGALGDDGLPDLSLHGWMVRLTRDIALDLVAEGAAAPAAEDWPVPPATSGFTRALAGLPAAQQQAVLAAWAGGAVARDTLRAGLTGLAGALPPGLRSAPGGADGIAVAEHLLRSLPADEEAAMRQRLPQDPPLRALRRAWSEALADLAPDQPAAAPPPATVAERVNDHPARNGWRALLRELDLVPLVIGSVLAALVAFGAYRFDAAFRGADAGISVASLRADPLAPALFEVAYADKTGRMLVQAAEGVTVPEGAQIWLRAGADPALRLGGFGAEEAQYVTIPDGMARDLTGAQVSVRDAAGATLASGRLGPRQGHARSRLGEGR